MAKKKKRKTRVTKKAVKAFREAKKNRPSSYKSKKIVRPGPWTDINTKLEVKANLRKTNGIMGPALGTYPRDQFWHEPGWYPIIFNLISKSIKRDVDAYGLDEYIAACEKSLNTPDNQKKYGTVVILKVEVDHSLKEDRARADRFISVRAKTNKKSIKGFMAHRKGIYKVIE